MDKGYTMVKFKAGDEIVQANNIEGATFLVNAVGKENYLIQGTTYGCEFSVYIGGVTDKYLLKPVKVWTEDDIQPGDKFETNQGIVYSICECKGALCVVWWVGCLGELSAYVEDKDFFVKRLNSKTFTKVI